MPAQACYRNLKATDINKTGMLGKKCLQSAQTSCKLTNTSCFIRPALEVPGNWPCSKPAIRVHAKSVLAATGQKWRSPQRRLHKSVPGNQGWQYHVHHAEKQSELAHWTMRKLVPGDRGGENSRLKTCLSPQWRFQSRHTEFDMHAYMYFSTPFSHLTIQELTGVHLLQTKQPCIRNCPTHLQVEQQGSPLGN